MTAGPRRDTKWWGWGDPAVNSKLDSPALGVLRERLGELRAGPVPIPLEDFELPPAEPLPSSLIAAIGADNIFSGAEDRLRHATGRGYIDLARLRQGPVRCPGCGHLSTQRNAVSRILELCAAEGVAVVPFGGGTSVVGGIEPLRGSHPRLISLDLRRLDQVVVDPRSLTARLGAGLRGPQAERALGAGPRRDLGASPSHFSTRPSAALGPPPDRPGKHRVATGVLTRWSPRSGCLRRPASCRRGDSPQRRGPGPARARAGLRGDLWRDTRRHGEGARPPSNATMRGGSRRALPAAARSFARWRRVQVFPM